MLIVCLNGLCSSPLHASDPYERILNKGSHCYGKCPGRCRQYGDLPPQCYHHCPAVHNQFVYYQINRFQYCAEFESCVVKRNEKGEVKGYYTTKEAWMKDWQELASCKTQYTIAKITKTSSYTYATPECSPNCIPRYSYYPLKVEAPFNGCKINQTCEGSEEEGHKCVDRKQDKRKVFL